MNPKNYTAFCNICQHKSFESKRGIVCGKTDHKPDFEESCELFEEKEESVQARKYMAENPVDPDRASVHKISSRLSGGYMLGFVLLVLGVFVLFVTTSKGRPVILIGAIGTGILLMAFRK
jgi:hypothetical protein